MKTLTWQKPGQQNVAQELIKIIINYVAELRSIIYYSIIKYTSKIGDPGEKAIFFLESI